MQNLHLWKNNLEKKKYYVFLNLLFIEWPPKGFRLREFFLINQ